MILITVVSETVYTATQCEGDMSRLMLSCPGKQRLLIRSAMFGRQDLNKTCPHATGSTVNNCASPQATEVVQTLCNGRHITTLASVTRVCWCSSICNFLPSSFRQPHSVHSPLGSPHLAHITSSQTLSSLSPSITPTIFYSRLKSHLFHKSFPPNPGSIWTAFSDHEPGLD